MTSAAFRGYDGVHPACKALNGRTVWSFMDSVHRARLQNTGAGRIRRGLGANTGGGTGSMRVGLGQRHTWGSEGAMVPVGV